MLFWVLSCVLFLAAPWGRADCYKSQPVPSFDVEHVKLRSFIRGAWLPSNCRLLIASGVNNFSHLQFQGGDWYDLFIQLAVENGLEVSRTRHFVSVSLASAHRVFWPYLQQLIAVHHQRPTDLVRLLNKDKAFDSQVELVADDSKASILVSAPMQKIDWIIAKVQSLDQPESSYFVEAKIIFVREGSESRAGLHWQGYQGVLLSWPRKSFLSVSWLVKGLGTLLWDTIESYDNVLVEARPYLRVVAGKKAGLESGDERPYESYGKGLSSATVQFKKALLSFNLLVKTLPHSRVHLELDLQQNLVSHQAGLGIPVVQNQHINLQENLSLNEVMVVGGMYRRVDGVSHQAPYWPHWLKRWFFRKSAQEKQQLLLLLRVRKVV